MANNFFSFKQFTVYQDKCAFKVGTDGVLLGACSNVSNVRRIMEIGTGTGLIALMLAQRSEAEIVAIEPDYESFTQACENVSSSIWRDRIKIINSNLQDYYPSDKKFDLIVTNPPYFIDSLKNPDYRKSSARHDDSLSHADLLEGITRLLEKDGLVQTIMPYTEGTVFIAEAQEYGLFCNSMIKIRPLPSGEIRRLILGFNRKRSGMSERFLTIERGKRYEFTDEYINLTKDFYLSF
jgi:tRNA1Val (adenine37-N6)-methyltransferase